jgi:hypothetical protein
MARFARDGFVREVFDSLRCFNLIQEKAGVYLLVVLVGEGKRVDDCVPWSVDGLDWGLT